LVTSSDPQGRPTVYQLVQDVPGRLFSVGRLDQDTEGVLLLTDDGDLAHRLTHPSHEIVKEYRVRVSGTVSPAELASMVAGLNLEDGISRAKRARLVSSRSGESELLLQLISGKKRQVKRMCAAIGHPVLELRRVSFAGLSAGRLPRGRWRYLKPKEIEHLRVLAGMTEKPGNSSR
jgi:pseudouridine synthase